MRRLAAALIVVALVVLAALPWFGSDTLIQFGINTLLLAVLAQGWNIIGGYTGYASIEFEGWEDCLLGCERGIANARRLLDNA